MIALALVSFLAATTPQDPPTQVQYNEFKRCQGEWFGFYRTGVIIFGGTGLEATVHEAGKPMDDFLRQVDEMVVQSGAALDFSAGYAAYQAGWQRWDNWHNRRDAEDVYFESSPMTPRCNEAVARIASFLDAR